MEWISIMFENRGWEIALVCVLLVGAGISYSQGLKGWPRLDDKAQQPSLPELMTGACLHVGGVMLCTSTVYTAGDLSVTQTMNAATVIFLVSVGIPAAFVGYSRWKDYRGFRATQRLAVKPPSSDA